MTTDSIAQLSDRELLHATRHAIDRERRSTAELISLLAELDTRRLYLGEGYSSLFTYCTQALRLSEPAAYSRITAARATRRFPVLLARLVEGDITLTTITLLAAHLTEENLDSLIDAACHKTKREVERLVASLHAQPDIAPSIRKLPEPARIERPPSALSLLRAPTAERSPVGQPSPAVASRRVAVAPIAADRYLLRITIAGDTHRKLECARDLLRHAIPDGDPAAIVDRALTFLLEQLEKRKLAATVRPRRGRPETTRSRRVPAAVRRAVWSRDKGQCAFVGALGRCQETGFLEFHHVQPFAAGGATTVGNLQLRCRAHNAHEATLYGGVSD